MLTFGCEISFRKIIVLRRHIEHFGSARAEEALTGLLNFYIQYIIIKYHKITDIIAGAIHRSIIDMVTLVFLAMGIGIIFGHALVCAADRTADNYSILNLLIN